MGAVLSCLSNLMYIGEKFTLYLVCTSLIWCLVITLLVTLCMGIGLGYNYCFVDMKTKYKYVPGRYIYPGTPPYDWRPNRMDNTEIDTPEDKLRKPLLDYNNTQVQYFNPFQENNDTFVTDSETALDNHTVLIDSYPLNGSESSTDAVIELATNDETLELTENETNNSDQKSSTILVEKTSIMPVVIDKTEPPTDPLIEESINNKPSDRRVKTLVIPISGLDLISLLTKLKVENKNYSLQIVTT